MQVVRVTVMEEVSVTAMGAVSVTAVSVTAVAVVSVTVMVGSDGDGRCELSAFGPTEANLSLGSPQF